MKVKLDITPSTRMIRSWRMDTRIKLDAVIKELVDNSFDAFANTVSIAGRSTMISVCDDGLGISDIESALRFGASESSHRRLGRHGVALKKGPARLAHELHISTCNGRETITANINWLNLERSNDWSSLDFDIRATKGRDTFTQVTIFGLYRYRILGWKDLPAKLSATFAPGLRDGKKILFDDQLLVAPPMPELEELIEAEGSVGSLGRRFIVRAGLRPEGQTGSIGASISYNHRVIVEEWAPRFLLGCSMRRFSASVTLIDGPSRDEDAEWQLNEFKDDFDEEQKEQLEAALEPILKPLIERLREESYSLRIKTLEKRIAHILFDSTRKDPCLRKDKNGDTIRPPVPVKKGRRQKKRRQKFAQREGQEVKEGGERAWVQNEHRFSIRFDLLPSLREMIHISSNGNSLALYINTAHKYGRELEAQFNRNEYDTVIATALWSLASYMTSKDDYQAMYPYMLNGQDSVFDATNMNVSRWLEYGATMT